MVFDGQGTFKYERKTPPKVGFYIWLESLNLNLDTRLQYGLSTSCLIIVSQLR